MVALLYTLSTTAAAQDTGDSFVITPPDITAKALFVVDATTGIPLYTKNPDEHLPIGSVVKIMTALVVMKHVEDLDEPVVIQESDLVDVSVYSNMNLQAGDTLTVSFLLYGLLIPSGNDGARALARHVGGKISGSEDSRVATEAFVNEMNAYAAELGLKNSRFTVPDGTDAPNAYSSAEDVSIMSRELMKNDTLRRIVREPAYQFYSIGPEQRLYAKETTNQRLGQNGVVGVKTGTTEQAGGNVVLAREVNGGSNTVIIVILGADHSYETGDPNTPDARWTDADSRHVIHGCPVRLDEPDNRRGPSRVERRDGGLGCAVEQSTGDPDADHRRGDDRLPAPDRCSHRAGRARRHPLSLLRPNRSGRPAPRPGRRGVHDPAYAYALEGGRMSKRRQDEYQDDDVHKPTGERLQRVLAQRGVASRRASEELITDGRVQVNGRVVTQLGTRVDPMKDEIRVDGKPVRRQKPRFIVLNKPSGFITTVSDEKQRWTVMNLVEVEERVYPVGRLDRETQGIILLTNVGEVANRVMHPRYRLAKEYQVITDRKPNDRQMQTLRDGILIEDRVVVPDECRLLRETPEGIIIKIVIHEGLYHVVRQMMESVGINVVRLRRVRIGPLSLTGIPNGAWRDLTPGELVQLYEAVGLPTQDAEEMNTRRPQQLTPVGGFQHMSPIRHPQRLREQQEARAGGR